MGDPSGTEGTIIVIILGRIIICLDIEVGLIDGLLWVHEDGSCRSIGTNKREKEERQLNPPDRQSGERGVTVTRMKLVRATPGVM